MRKTNSTEARSGNELWGRNPHNDLDIVLANPKFVRELSVLQQQLRNLPPERLASYDRGAVLRDILTQNGFAPYAALTEMLLQMVKRQSRS